jgi:cytochrome c-type biogenesis protein CcmE
VGGKRSPARLVVALSVAAVLAIFLVYTAIAGGGTPSVKPSQLAGHNGRVSLVGKVVGHVTGQSHSAAGMRFRVQDIGGTAAVPVVYHGSVPDLFGRGRHVVVDGRVRHGTFVAVPGTLITKCPSKYTPKQG